MRTGADGAVAAAKHATVQESGSISSPLSRSHCHSENDCNQREFDARLWPCMLSRLRQTLISFIALSSWPMPAAVISNATERNTLKLLSTTSSSPIGTLLLSSKMRVSAQDARLFRRDGLVSPQNCGQRKAKIPRNFEPLCTHWRPRQIQAVRSAPCSQWS